MSNKIGARIRELREQKELTQIELAKEIKKQFGFSVKRETIAQWESGTRDLKTDYTIVLAKCFGVPSDYLLGLSDDPNPRPSAVDQLGLTPRARDIIESDTATPRIAKVISGIIEHNDFFWVQFYLGAGLDAYKAGKEHEASTASDKQDFERYQQAAPAHGAIVLSPRAAADYFSGKAKENLIRCVDDYLNRKIVELDMLSESIVLDDDDD